MPTGAFLWNDAEVRAALGLAAERRGAPAEFTGVSTEAKPPSSSPKGPPTARQNPSGPAGSGTFSHRRNTPSSAAVATAATRRERSTGSRSTPTKIASSRPNSAGPVPAGSMPSTQAVAISRISSGLPMGSAVSGAAGQRSSSCSEGRALRSASR